EGGRIALRGLLRYETTQPFGSSLVDCDVQPPKMLDRLIDEIADIIFGPHVRPDEFGLSSESLSLRRQILSFRFATPVHNYVRPFFSKYARRGSTNPFECA